MRAGGTRPGSAATTGDGWGRFAHTVLVDLRARLAASADPRRIFNVTVQAGGDDYASPAKPQIDWDNQAAREQLIDSRARDVFACLALLEGRELAGALAEAAALLAGVLGQGFDETADGVFRIARRVAKGRIISTVDPDARHGHKTATRGFDGYKGHVAADPDERDRHRHRD